LETNLKNLVEALLFSADNPLTEKQLLKFFSDEEKPEMADLKAALAELEKDYEDRGIALIKVASGYRFQVKERWSPWIVKMWDEKPHKYSRALLETLALIAYRQPITRGEIEDIRGVAVSTNIIRTLEEREWVRVVGHKEVPGRPALLATTKGFLDYFGLNSLQQLPSLPEVMDLDSVQLEKTQEELEPIVAVEETITETDIDSDLEVPELEEAVAEMDD